MKSSEIEVGKLYGYQESSYLKPVLVSVLETGIEGAGWAGRKSGQRNGVRVRCEETSPAGRHRGVVAGAELVVNSRQITMTEEQLRESRVRENELRALKQRRSEASSRATAALTRLGVEARAMWDGGLNIEQAADNLERLAAVLEQAALDVHPFEGGQ